MVILELLVWGQHNYRSAGRCHVCFAVGKKINQQLQIGILLKKTLEIAVKGVVFDVYENVTVLFLTSDLM
jgi:hypothetical protein